MAPEIEDWVEHGVSLRLVSGGEAARCAIVLPGRAYGPQAPLLWFARRALAGAGLAALEVWWDDPRPEHLRTALTAARRRLEPALVVAKSVGTRVLADAGPELPGIWLTPLLADYAVAAALREPRAPALVVVGGADPACPAERVAELRAAGRVELLELEGADHSLEVPDPARSLELLGRTTAAIAAFAERCRPS